jgi:hypothetical protein
VKPHTYGVKVKKLSKLGWVLAIFNVATFLYLNHILLIDLIQRVADTSDGYISIFDDDFVSDVSCNNHSDYDYLYSGSTAGGYFGAKKKFKQD